MVMSPCIPDANAVDVDNDATIDDDASDAAAMGPPDAVAAVVDKGCIHDCSTAIVLAMTLDDDNVKMEC